MLVSMNAHREERSIELAFSDNPPNVPLKEVAQPVLRDYKFLF